MQVSIPYWLSSGLPRNTVEKHESAMRMILEAPLEYATIDE